MSKIPEFLEALKIMEKVHISKNEDYADPSNPFSNFDVQAYISSLFKNDRDKVFACMIAVKLARLATLLNKEDKPNNESIEDTFIDQANYTLLWRSDYIRRNKRKLLTNLKETIEEIDKIKLPIYGELLEEYTCDYCELKFKISIPLLSYLTKNNVYYFCCNSHRDRFIEKYDKAKISLNVI